jgi:type III secretion protein N (ATPase)
MKLPKLLERAGTTPEGSITGIYTVLTNGEGEVDPLGEEIKSILDGHIVLDSKLAERGIRPAIDLTVSVSRVISRLRSSNGLEVAQIVREILSRLKRDRDLILFGGTPDVALKAALALEAKLLKALTQRPSESRTLQSTDALLRDITQEYHAALGA